MPLCLCAFVPLYVVYFVQRTAYPVGLRESVEELRSVGRGRSGSVGPRAQAQAQSQSQTPSIMILIIVYM